MSGALFDQIVAAGDLPEPKPVVVPEWGDVTVYIHGLTVGEVERAEHLAAKSQSDGTGLVLATFMAFGVRDADGNRIFDDHEIPIAAAKGLKVVRRLAGMVRAKSGLGASDAEQRKLVEDEVGNSPATQSGASSSA